MTGRRKMSGPTWRGDAAAPGRPLGAGDWTRAILRGAGLAAVNFGGLAVLLALRLIERPLFGARRPWTPHITRAVCRAALRILGIRRRTLGRPMTYPGASVSNHASWLDIFALNAGAQIYFVSKSEVSAWPGIGWLARATGTVFIRRNSREAPAQKTLFETRLLAGHRLHFFPEGTSTDGRVVLPFKTTLFAAFFADNLRDLLRVQPVSVIYRAPEEADPRFYGWWGDMEFGPHLLQVLAARTQGSVTVHYHEPLQVTDFADRKALARAAEEMVRMGLAEAGGVAPPPAAQATPPQAPGI